MSDDQHNSESEARTIAATEKFLDVLDTVPNLRSAAFVEDPVVDKWSQGFKFHGLVGVFDNISDLGTHTEGLERGAVRKYMATGQSVPFLLEHNDGRPPIATTHAKTLQVAESPKGVEVDADVPDTTDGRDLYILTKRGDIRGMSWGAVVGRGNSKITLRNGKPHRMIQGFKRILDVSATWNPAYPATTAEFRSSAEFRSAAMQFAGQPDLLQLLLGGDFPQPQEMGDTVMEEEAEARSDGLPDSVVSGVAASLSVAARKRALEVFLLSTGGIKDAQR
jgi:HK97 family phage prohead protease